MLRIFFTARFAFLLSPGGTAGSFDGHRDDGAHDSVTCRRKGSIEQAAAKIDGFVESHRSAHGIQPANRSDDATFLRRDTLDLAG